jgi:uncharacterized integral membrane protein
MSQLLLKRGVIVIAASGIILYFYFADPAKSSFGVPCLLHSATGLLCWGCGGQRAFHQLLHGNFKEAFQLNALVFPVVMLLAYVLISELTKINPSYPFIRKRRVSLSILFFVIVFTVLRNVI